MDFSDICRPGRQLKSPSGTIGGPVPDIPGSASLAGGLGKRKRASWKREILDVASRWAHSWANPWRLTLRVSWRSHNDRMFASGEGELHMSFYGQPKFQKICH